VSVSAECVYPYQVLVTEVRDKGLDCGAAVRYGGTHAAAVVDQEEAAENLPFLRERIEGELLGLDCSAGVVGREADRIAVRPRSGIKAPLASRTVIAAVSSGSLVTSTERTDTDSAQPRRGR